MIKFKKVIIFILVIVFFIGFSPSVFADDTEKCSLYFDNDASFSKIKISSNYVDKEISPMAKKGASLLLKANYKKDSLSGNTMVYFTSEDFGLEDFSGCTISADINYSTDLSKKITSISLFCDGNKFVEQKFQQAKSFKNYQLQVPEDNKNNLIGIFIQFNDEYDGDICNIDNLIIKTKNGDIATIKDVNDEVVINPQNIAPVIIGIILLVAIIGASIFLIIKKMTRYY